MSLICGALTWLIENKFRAPRTSSTATTDPGKKGCSSRAPSTLTDQVASDGSRDTDGDSESEWHDLSPPSWVTEDHITTFVDLDKSAAAAAVAADTSARTDRATWRAHYKRVMEHKKKVTQQDSSRHGHIRRHSGQPPSRKRKVPVAIHQVVSRSLLSQI